VKALVVDEQPLARRGLSSILRDDVGVEEVIEAAGGAEAIAITRTRAPELVLIATKLPGSIPTREICAQLRAFLPHSSRIIVTAFDHPGEIRDCMLAGADGCLLKDSEGSALARSIRGVIAGETAIDLRIAQGIAAEAVAGGDRRAPITTREREVLSLLADGYSNRRIATQLVISETTVKGHVSNLIEKLNVSSRLEVVSRAIKTGLI
jgi:two-component system, NarL family, nitrate/nitrite response regulator NarL